MKISNKLNELKPVDLNCNVFDVYSYDGLSMQELLCQFFTKINECVKLSNETIDLATWLVNEGLKIEVVKKLILWLEDGTLENLINVNLFNTLNNKIENIYLNVKDLGAIGDGVADDTEAIQSAFDIAKSKDVNIFFPNGVYKISNGISIANAYNITIEGNQSTIQIYNSSTTGYSVFNLQCLKNKSVSVNGLILNGENTPQDLFDNTEYNNTPRTVGFAISANKINMTNLELYNWYGTAIMLKDYRNVLISNTQIKNVGGHWHQNNEFDAFGDAIYLGEREIADIIIDNVCAEGKTRSDGKVSRIGITIENLSNIKDIETNIYVRNSKFVGYDRCIHSEANTGIVKMKLDHCILQAHVILMGWNNGIRSNGSISDCVISFYDGSYNGARGIAYQWGELNINDTVIDGANNKNYLGMNIDKLIMSNSTVNNITSTIVENSKFKVYNSIFNISESLEGYLFYGTDENIYEFIDCKFKNIENTKIIKLSTAGISPILKDCEFYNIQPKYNNLDLAHNTRLYISSGVNGFSESDYYNINLSVFMDDELIISPNICGLLPAKANVNISNCHYITSFDSSSNIPIIPSDLKLNCWKKIIIVIKGNNSDYTLTSGSIGHGYGQGVYVVSGYWDGTKYVIGNNVTRVGYDPGSCGMELSIDTSNNTISKGTYSAYVNRVERLILPYDYINYLPFII